VIITDESLLRPKCEDVLAEEVDDLRNKLERALDWSERRGHPGVGLACPQIGIAKRMAIVRVDKLKIDLVNAKITKRYHQFEFDGEGCLSFPGRYERTLRYEEVLVEGLLCNKRIGSQDIKNLVQPYRFIAIGFVAVIIQHELNHLDGILLPDVAVVK
jgi:peptide deformylase